jgi:ABC-2 type transport system permease protein
VSALAGSGSLVRLALRRDRIMIPAWVASIALLTAGTASSYQELFPTARERTAFAATVAANTSFRALYGPAFDLSTIGGITAWRFTGGAAVLAALMSLLLAVRHTRAEEESGRSELLGATVVGRHAGLAAALFVVAVANLGVLALTSLALAGLGLPGAGSIAFGAAVASCGCTFGAVAAVCAQATTTGRAAGGAAGALLGLAFVVRAAGDVGGGGLSWLSPIGWAQRVRPFAGERWWVLLVALATALVCTAGAAALEARRDTGAGLWPERLGPPAAARTLGTPAGLAWRLQRGVLLGWALGFAASGASVGLVARDIKAAGGDSPELGDILRQLGGARGLVDAYLGATLVMFALVAAGYAIQAVLRLRSEESSMRAEAVLAGSVARWRWAGGHLVCAAAGAVVLMAAVGATTGFVHGLRAGDVGGQTTRVVEAALLQVPATWVLGALAFACAAAFPRAAALGWVGLGLSIGISEVGALLGLPGWVLDLSPLQHVPTLPLHDVDPAPLLALTAVGAGLALAGLAGLARRDIV